MEEAAQGESWFTRFMRLANAMYSHRVNTGSKRKFHFYDNLLN